MTAAAIAEFRRAGGCTVPPDASPLLASILLAIDLCRSPAQLAAWWDWPPHRNARWRLSPDEAAIAAETLQRRQAALLQAP